MSTWTVHKDPTRDLPWRARNTDDRGATEHGFGSQWSAFAYALVNADPRAELIP